MDTEAGVTSKQVKLKVLYTFDIEHKNNHLARWPQTLEVQSAQLDEANIIGCVDLRTCLEAITNASPELTSNNYNDFTVYAYDYSEPDTPLVGQGMLSKALGQDGNMEVDNEAMITGRITKNVMGLFSKNAQETLEVKLRLTPVASPGFHRRSGSVSSNPDTAQSNWNSLPQNNGGFRPSSPMDTSGLEAMQRMVSEGGPPRDRAGSAYGDTLYNQAQASSRPGSRAGTPMQSQQFNQSTRQSASQSRPVSRNGVRTTTHARRDSFNSGYYSGEEAIEDGPARKRAKVQKVSNPSKTNLNIERQPDSLRVAASTASSVRLHRPVPLNPAAAALLHSGNFGEEPMRPPTPIAAPTKTGRPRGRPRKVVSANLLRGPKPRASSPASQMQQSIEMSFTSPEDTRAESVTSTPADLPSSPPVMPETQNFVTSPQLPPLANEADSGFMSGCLEDFFGEDTPLLDFNDFLHEKPLDPNSFNHELYTNSTTNDSYFNNDNVTANLPSVFDEGNETEQVVAEMEPPAPPLPPPVLPKSASVPVLPKAASFTSNHRPIVPAPRLAPALAPRLPNSYDERRAHSTMPQIPASDPVGRPFQRSNTWAPDMSDAIMSDAITNDEQAKAKPRKRVGREQTKARLENAIASGEMPPFCENCGSIETPAWRRAYTKIFECAWDDLQTSLEPGECCYKEPLEHDENGNIVKIKGYKSERRHEEKESEGWVQICLCNPCGLWFHKSKFPRPPEKWQKKDPNEKKRKKRGGKVKKKAPAPKLVTRDDDPTPASDDSSPADTSAEGGDMDDNLDVMTANGDEANDENEPDLPPMPRSVRGGSVEPTNRGLKFHGLNHAKHFGQRQIQSSPARAGHTRTTAIEIDLTPKPVRRQLFPSPESLKNKSEAIASTLTKEDFQLPNFVRRSPRLNKIRDVFAPALESVAVTAVGISGKENVAPISVHGDDDDDDGLRNLFDSGFDEPMPPPTTPKRRSERLLFKTPGKTPSRDFGDGMSPNVQRTPTASRTPRNMHSLTSKFMNEMQKGSNSVEMTPFSKLIHDSFHYDDTGLMNCQETPRSGGSARAKKSAKRATLRDAGEFFDFPDLPSLKGSSPVGVDLMQAFDFSEMTTDHIQPDFNDVFNTDMPMPSSPPQGYFSYMNGKHSEGLDVWADAPTQSTESTYPSLDNEDSQHTDANSSGPRRSPRKHNA